MPGITKQDFVKFFNEWHTNICPMVWRIIVIDENCCDDCEFKDESVPIEDRIKNFWQKCPMKEKMRFMKTYNAVQDDCMKKMFSAIEEYKEKETPPKYGESIDTPDVDLLKSAIDKKDKVITKAFLKINEVEEQYNRLCELVYGVDNKKMLKKLQDVCKTGIRTTLEKSAEKYFEDN